MFVEKEGFTLTELLVVILIISIMIGILLPALAGAINAATAVQCKSNLRQLGAAFLMYLNDWQMNIFPVQFIGGPTDEYPNGGVHLFCGKITDSTTFPQQIDRTKGFLNTYYENNNESINVCPAFNGNFVQRFINEKGGADVFSYGYNYNYLGYDWGSGPWGGHKYTNWGEVKDHTHTVVFADSANIDYYSLGSPSNPVVTENFFLEPPSYAAGPWPVVNVHFRHNGTANVLYMDGHVEAKRLDMRYSADALLRKAGLVTTRITEPIGQWTSSDEEFDLQ